MKFPSSILILVYYSVLKLGAVRLLGERITEA